MKKFLVIALCALTLAAFTACDNSTPTEEAPVSLFTGTMGGVQFPNDDSLRLDEVSEGNYKAVGDLASMTSEQAAAWGASEGALYITLKVKDISADNPVKAQGWVNAIESTDYKDPRSGSVNVGKILAISNDGKTIRADLEGCYIWKVVLEDGATYTVDLTDQAEALATAAE